LVFIISYCGPLSSILTTLIPGLTHNEAEVAEAANR